ASIDDLFHRTADKVFDPTTNTSYDQINVPRALNTLVGPDDFGSTVSAATSVGQLSNPLHLAGTIGSTTDQDYFQFVAAKSGKATLALTDPQRLAAIWEPMAGGQINGNQLTFNMVAGQSYIVGIAGGGTTIGKYAVDMQFQP